MSDDDSEKWAALKAEMSRADPSLPAIYEGADVMEPEVRRRGVEHEPDDDGDMIGSYPRSQVRTYLSDQEQDEVRPDDVFEWKNDDGGYYLWSRAAPRRLG